MRWMLGVGVLCAWSSCACFTPVSEDAGSFGGGASGGGGALGGGMATGGGVASGGGSTANGGGSTANGGGGAATGGSGQDDGGLDASTDAGPPPILEPVTLEGTTDDRIIRLKWDAGAMTPASWLVRRNGGPLMRIAGTARSYDDITSPPGALGSFDASASLEMSMGIEVEWTEPPSAPGPQQQFDVVAEFPDASMTSTTVTLQLAAPRVVGYLISRTDGGITTSPDASFWLDTDAPIPTLTVTGLVSRAIPDDRSSSVALIADASVAAPPAVTGYTIEALASAGANPSATATGSRSLRVEYQWQRSAADDTNNFVDLPSVHGTEWADFEAVFSEGRYYRVAVRGGGLEFISSPTRAVLVRPIGLLTHVWAEPWLVREDGLAISLGYQQASRQLPVAHRYFLTLSGPGALLDDGGVVVWRGGPGPIPVTLPPSNQVAVDRNLICVKVDGGVACDPPLPSSMDTSALVDLTMVNQDLICGHLDDAGVRCVSRTAASIDIGPVLATWMVDQSIVKTWAGGATDPVTVFPIAGDPLPLEDAGYVAPFFSNMCAIREDGFLRCSRWASNYLSSGLPISREGVASGSAMDGTSGYASGCVFTLAGRVHCRGRVVVTTPPPPPVIAVSEGRLGNGIFLGGDGRIDAIPLSGWWASPAIAFDDQIVELSGSLDDIAIVRADRSAAIETRSWPEPFTSVSGPYGVRADGGILALRTGQPVTTANASDAVAWLLNDQFCARQLGVWQCTGIYGSFPGDDHHVVVGWNQQICALTPRGKADCRPPLSEPWVSMRFRDARGGASLVLTTVDGRQITVSPGPVAQTGLPYDDYLGSAGRCGVRRDGTAFCDGAGVVRYPWTGR